MAKKILIFSMSYYPHVGGAEVAIKEITERLPRGDYEFHLIANRYDATLPQVEQVGNVLVHRIGLSTKSPTMTQLRRFPLHLNKIFFQWLAFAKAKKLHRQHQYDAVWAMMAHATGVPTAKFKTAFPKVKYILTLQEGDPPEVIESKMRPFGHWFADAFLLADTVQVISSFLGAWAKRMGFVGSPVLIPNAVDIKHFTQTYQPAELLKAKDDLGKKSGEVYLVTTSRLVYKNAVDDVVRSLSFLPDSVKFVIFGTGPEEEKLKKIVEQLKLKDRVLFKGHIDHKDMPLYLKACDIFVRPSRSEGMGNSFIEAMAAGLPVIATQEGGIADFLFDAKRNPNKESTGFAVTKDSPEEIASTVKEIMDSPHLVKSVVLESQKMVVEKYDWDLIADRMDREVFQPLFN